MSKKKNPILNFIDNAFYQSSKKQNEYYKSLSSTLTTITIILIIVMIIGILILKYAF